MRRGASSALIALLIAFLLASILIQAWIFPAGINRAVAEYPEIEALAVPAIVWAVITTACLQAAAIIGLRI